MTFSNKLKSTCQKPRQPNYWTFDMDIDIFSSHNFINFPWGDGFILINSHFVYTNVSFADVFNQPIFCVFFSCFSSYLTFKYRWIGSNIIIKCDCCFWLSVGVFWLLLLFWPKLWKNTDNITIQPKSKQTQNVNYNLSIIVPWNFHSKRLHIQLDINCTCLFIISKTLSDNFRPDNVKWWCFCIFFACIIFLVTMKNNQKSCIELVANAPMCIHLHAVYKMWLSNCWC